MTSDEVYKLITDNGLTLHGDIEHFATLVANHIYAKYLEPLEPKQSGTISITIPAPVAYLCENAVGHKYFRWKKPSGTYKPIPLYTHPPQCTEQEPCAKHCEATAFQIVIKNLQGEIERMKTAQRTWVGLTDEERKEVWWSCEQHTPTTLYKAIEAKLKEKNT